MIKSKIISQKELFAIIVSRLDATKRTKLPILEPKTPKRHKITRKTRRFNKIKK